MSRLEKKIALSGVTVKKEIGLITFSGEKGSVCQTFPSTVDFIIKDGFASVDIALSERKNRKALQGLYIALVKNHVKGVREGYRHIIKIVGIGWQVNIKEKQVLEFILGYPYPIYFVLPSSVTVSVIRQQREETYIALDSPDKQLLGEVTANIKRLRKSDPYKGKGIYKEGDYIIRKDKKASGK